MSKLTCLTKGKDRAFPAHPRIDRYFPAKTMEDARVRLLRCIDRGDGPALVIGPTGAGKTLLLQLLAAQFADRFSIACLTSSPMSSRRALLQAILFELRQPYRERDEGELRLALVDLLLDEQSCPDGILLLIDEAHLLPTKLLEELRVLSNLMQAGEPRIRLVLAGSLQLDEIFAAPELEVFSQRLAARCYLAPLTHRETAQYTRAQVAKSGAKPEELFAPDALDAVYQATDGVPRLVNQVCDHALLLADERGARRLDKLLIEAAWSDLQQLPSPWAASHEPVPAPSANVIEFGALDGNLPDVEEPTITESMPADPFCSGPTMRVFHSSASSERTPAETMRGERDSDPQDWSSSPFAEPFAEEEIVLDRFASLEAAFGAKTPRVYNRHESCWSHMLNDVNAVQPNPVDCEPLLVADREGAGCCEKIDAPILAKPSEAIDLEVELGPATLAVDLDVISIEDDTPASVVANPHVVRREYRQLFSALRGD